MTSRGWAALLLLSLAPAAATPLAPPTRYRLGDAIFHAVGEPGTIPENDVNCLAEDAAGFLWIGTSDGVLRYDGYTFRTFRRDLREPRSLADNNIRVIRGARDGRVWIGTNGAGLSVFDPRTETFQSLTAETGLASNAVRDVAEAGGGAMWVGTTNGLHLVDGQTLRVTPAEAKPSGRSEAAASIGALLVDRHGQLWIGSAEGLTVRRTGGALEAMGEDVLAGKPVYRLFEARDGALWIGIFGGGLARLDPATGIARLLERELRPLAFAEPEPGAIWVGTIGEGIRVLDAATGELRETHRHDVSLPESIASNRISSLRVDRSGLVWIGTTGRGLCRFNPADALFRTLRASPSRPESLGDSEVESVLESRDGLLWVGTHAQGVEVFDATRRVAAYRPGGPAGRTLDTGNVGALAETADGAVWMGTFAAVHRLDRGSGRIERLAAEAFGKTTGRVSVLVPAPGGAGLWVASTGGLAFLDLKTRLATPARLENGQPLSGNVTDVAMGPDGRIWASGAAGVAVLEPGASHFLRLTRKEGTSGTLPEGSVLDLLFDRQGRLWAGMSTGLVRLAAFDGKTARFENLAPRLGIENRRCDNLLEDLDGRLWIEDDLVVDPVALTYRTFGPDEGAGRTLWRGAALATRSGQLVFGGAEGLFLVDPPALREWTYAPPVVLTSLAVGGRPVPPGGLGELVIPPGGASISFELAALDFSAPRRLRYAYRLRGFDPAFVEVDSERRGATYTSLPPGDYVLEARGSNRNGVFSPATLSLPIRVRPAFYQHTLFKVAAGLFLVSLTWPVYRVRLRLLEARQRELEGLVALRTGELRASERRALEASEAKSVFLANMSHELRTPLNAVLGFAQLMRRSPGLGESDRESLHIIQRSGEHLLGLINQVLSISKIEAGKMTLELQPFDPRELLETLERMLRARAEEAGLDFRMELEGLPGAVRGDAGKLRQALLNLLGNAVKFTPKGTVTLRARWATGRAWFEVSDTGAGIAPGELASLFQPFVQTEAGRRAREGTGLGLVITRHIVELMGGAIRVESTVGRGTTFAFDIVLEECAPVAAAAPAPRVRRLAPDQAPPRVVVVDDTPENRALLVRLLEATGFQVRQAEDGAKGVALVREWEAHAAFMDMRMPVMDGREAIRRIRREEAEGGRRRTVLVGLTASVYAEDADSLRAEGADDVVFKPFHESDIFDVLASRLGLRYEYEDEPAPAAAVTRAADAAAPGVAAWDGARRVLVADDDPVNRALAREVLAGEGYEVVEARDGAEALSLLEGPAPFQAVLLDVEMPRLGGIEAVRRMRADERFRRLPVLAMTAHDDASLLARLLEAGMDDHVAKPFEPDELAMKLQVWIDRRSAG